MSVLNKRNILVGIATFVIGISTCAVIWGVPKFMKRSTTVNGRVTAYLLNNKGEVDGLLLASGDQLQFSAQTGAIVTTQIKVGDEVTASGHAGTKSSHGREVKVEKLSANGQTIVAVKAGPPRPHGPKDDRGPKGHHRKPGDREDEAADAQAKPVQTQPVQTQQTDAAATTVVQPVAPAAPELFTANATISTYLVNGHGDVDGLILSSGEQMSFSPKVGELILEAVKAGSTQITVEGAGVRNERGTVILPTKVTVGTQTIALER